MNLNQQGVFDKITNKTKVRDVWSLGEQVAQHMHSRGKLIAFF